MRTLQAVVLIVVGFTACAEFGSYAFVHPVIRKLPDVEQVAFEKGLLRTFGRFMPVAMTVSPILLGSWAASLSGSARLLAALGATAATVGLVTTIAVNVGINRATGHWDPEHPPADWRATRRRWDRFQGIRSSLLLLGFVLAVLASAA